MKFIELPLFPEILQGLSEAGYGTCMPVQEMTVPPLIEGRDIFAQSQTGSGKTAAFLVSLFQLLMEDREANEQALALIIAPTRELAVQIEEEAKLLGKYTGLVTATCYGGVSYEPQVKTIREGVDIIIGTPGRILDLDQKGHLPLRDISHFVIDEADRLFDMGFLPDLKRMLSKMPRREIRQTMLFSATLDTRVRQIAHNYMYDPVSVEVTPESVTVDRIKQEVFHVAKKQKISLLLGQIKALEPRSTIIFTNLKWRAKEIAERLCYNGYAADHISGDLAQNKRSKLIERMKRGELKFLVATDVAARGIHIDDLDLVVNYDVPFDPENYVHRIGRTARAGKNGRAITFACEEFVEHLEAVEKYIGMKIPTVYPGDEDMAPDSSQGISFKAKSHSHSGRSGTSSNRRSSGSSSRKGSVGGSGGRRPDGKGSGSRPQRSPQSSSSSPYKTDNRPKQSHSQKSRPVKSEVSVSEKRVVPQEHSRKSQKPSHHESKPSLIRKVASFFKRS